LCRAKMELLGRRFGKLGGFGSGGRCRQSVEASLYVMVWLGIGVVRVFGIRLLVHFVSGLQPEASVISISFGPTVVFYRVKQRFITSFRLVLD